MLIIATATLFSECKRIGADLGNSFLTDVDFISVDCPSSSPLPCPTLAPLIGLWQNDAFLEGHVDSLKVSPVRCARKKKRVDLLLPRSLVKKMQRLTVEEDEFRVKVVSRCSSRLSPLIRTSESDLEPIRISGLPPIDEEGVTGGECSAVDDLPGLLLASSSPIGVPVVSTQSFPASLSLPSPIEEVGTPIEEVRLQSNLFPVSVEEERSLSLLSAPLVSATETIAVHVAVNVADDLVPEVVEDDV
ncbi:hypothetical protein Dimus_015936 [Dionaea muscipula]